MESLSQEKLTIDKIQQALATNPLPGLAGQIKMAPEVVEGRRDRWDIPDYCRKASVLLMLYPYSTNGANQMLHLALTRRREYPGVHSGQISLPGGRREKDESLRETALRETEEELGVSPKSLEVVGKLSPLYTPPSNFCIYPFVAVRHSRPRFRLEPREVAELIEVPLMLLRNPAVHKKEIWRFEKYGEREVPFFEVFGHKVWGATAMILSEFLTLLNNNSAPG